MEFDFPEKKGTLKSKLIKSKLIKSKLIKSKLIKSQLIKSKLIKKGGYYHKLYEMQFFNKENNETI